MGWREGYSGRKEDEERVPEITRVTGLFPRGYRGYLRETGVTHFHGLPRWKWMFAVESPEFFRLYPTRDTDGRQRFLVSKTRIRCSRLSFTLRRRLRFSRRALESKTFAVKKNIRRRARRRSTITQCWKRCNVNRNRLSINLYFIKKKGEIFDTRTIRLKFIR